MQANSKNYQHQIQYDNKTGTIEDNLKKHTDKANPIIATLKAKRGQQSDIGFGTKMTKGSLHDKSEKPEQYLGPGYYEQKGGFDVVAAPKNAIPASKSCQNFLSHAPRFEGKTKPTAAIPGPGAYAPDGSGFNPWFKRSYNMLFAEH